MDVAQNKNMADEFNPHLINMTNESIIEWYTNFPPGYICVRHRPHTFVNMHHTIFCGLTSILWRTHIVEVKDKFRKASPKSEFGAWENCWNRASGV